MKKDLTRLSKFLAVILRHSPEKFGIKLDEQGFTSLQVYGKLLRISLKINIRLMTLSLSC